MEVVTINRVYCGYCDRWWPVTAAIANDPNLGVLRRCPGCCDDTDTRNNSVVCTNCGGMIERGVTGPRCLICAANMQRHDWARVLFNEHMLQHWTHTRRFTVPPTAATVAPLPGVERRCRCNKCGGARPPRPRR